MWLVEAGHTVVSILIGVLAGATLYDFAKRRGGLAVPALLIAVLFMLAGEVWL